MEFLPSPLLLCTYGYAQTLRSAESRFHLGRNGTWTKLVTTIELNTPTSIATTFTAILQVGSLMVVHTSSLYTLNHFILPLAQLSIIVSLGWINDAILIFSPQLSSRFIV